MIDAIAGGLGIEEKLDSGTMGEHPAARAYKLYLLGRAYWNRRDLSSLETAIDLFTEAAAADERYAMPLVGLADAGSMIGAWHWKNQHFAFTRAMKYLGIPAL